MDQINPKNTLKQQRSFFSPRLTIFTFIAFSLLLLIFIQIESITTLFPFSISTQWPEFLKVSGQNDSVICTNETNKLRSRLISTISFKPLKDAALSDKPSAGNTWFMSSRDDTHKDTDMSYLFLPSVETQDRILCISGAQHSDGTKNSYALVWPEGLPENASFLSGLTFVTDTYYDYINLWHGLSAMVPFAAWLTKHCTESPDRWLLYHWGEVRTQLGRPWLRALMEAATGRPVIVEALDEFANNPVCFEKALVIRSSEGRLNLQRKRLAYDMLRCKARKFCNVSSRSDGDRLVGLTLLLRKGARAFRDEEEVIKVFETECKNFEGCKFMVAWGNNLTFCDQVRLMSKTDILASPHGAQMTNMFLLDKNSSVMEFFPKGWLELAGAGQFVFHWMADWTGMRHRGVWRDPEGPECPFNNNNDCFTFYKDRELRHDPVFFKRWTATVLNEVKKGQKLSNKEQLTASSCPCS